MGEFSQPCGEKPGSCWRTDGGAGDIFVSDRVHIECFKRSVNLRQRLLERRHSLPSARERIHASHDEILYVGVDDTPAFQSAHDVRQECVRRCHHLGPMLALRSIEKEDMDSLGVKSILEVPIFLNDKEWGAIGFDDFEKERVWSTAEVDVLKIAAGVLSAAIQRQKADSALQESERIYRQAIEAAGAVPYYQAHRIDHYVFMGQGIEKITGYTPEEMSASLWNSIVQEEQLVGDLSGSDVHDASQRARTDDFDVWKCDYRIRSRDGQMKWMSTSASATALAAPVEVVHAPPAAPFDIRRIACLLCQRGPATRRRPMWAGVLGEHEKIGKHYFTALILFAKKLC